MIEKIEEKVYIIKPILNKCDDNSLDEIIALAESAGAVVVGSKTQVLREITPATFIGCGKLQEIKEEIEDAGTEIDLIVFDGELSPSQTLNIQEILSIKVIDRTTLILDIFALNAKSTEGKLQVELAQLKYIYPRLRGKGQALSQQGGGIGTRGPGETKLETDRRHIRRRIDFLESGLRELENRRGLQAERREKNNIKTVALVGYTNTGKSTLLNRLTGADVLVKNQLFATLDPTMRKLKLEDANAVLIDTVGFVRNIPHHLIEAFKSTLETAARADLVLIVCDATGDFENQLKTTEETLSDIKCESEKILVFNKCDGVQDFTPYPKDAVFISALTGQGVDGLLAKINDFFKNAYIAVDKKFDYKTYGALAKLEKFWVLKKTEFLDDGVYIAASIPKENYYKFKQYL